MMNKLKAFEMWKDIAVEMDGSDYKRVGDWKNEEGKGSAENRSADHMTRGEKYHILQLITQRKIQGR